MKEMISEEMPLSEVVAAPKEGPENFEIVEESGGIQRDNSVEEAGEQRQISSETDMREQREAESSTDGLSDKNKTVKVNDAIRYKIDGL